MANFDEAYKLTGHNEGGYANNPNDHGGETYAGIARKFWPEWAGWKIVDKVKSYGFPTVKQINEALSSNPDMQALIASFYRANFWSVLKLDQLNDQQLANAVYDFGVNAGVTVAAKMLQRSITPLITVDGIIGRQTIEAANEDHAETLYNEFSANREAFYKSLALKPGQSQFLNSWLSRIKPYRKSN